MGKFKSTPEVVVPRSMQAEGREARFEARIADTFDVETFTKGNIKRVVKNAHGDARGGASDGIVLDASDFSSSSDAEPSSAAFSRPTRAALDDAAASRKLAASGEKDAIESIFAFLDKDDSGAVTIRELIIGVREEPSLARALGLGEGCVDQDQLVEMFSKWDENGDHELDRAQFASIFGPSIANAERAEARRQKEARAAIVAKAVEERAFAKAEAAKRAEDEALNAAERADARLHEELDVMKFEVDTALPNRRVSARERLARRRRSPAAEKKSRNKTDARDAGYASEGSGPGASSARAGASAAKPAWHSPSYTTYLDSPAFKRLGMASALEAAKRPRAVNGLWRERLNVTALRRHEKKTRAADVVAEDAPIARYEERWRDALRNGDMKKFADRKPRPAGAPSPVGLEPVGFENLSGAEALADASRSPGWAFGGGERPVFSRGFQRHYHGASTRTKANHLAHPPGVKTSSLEVVGVTGLTRSHKSDLRHKGHVQPVSFHRNVVGDGATTHTSTAPGELTRYPKSERAKHERVWI